MSNDVPGARPWEFDNPGNRNNATGGSGNFARHREPSGSSPRPARGGGLLSHGVLLASASSRAAEPLNWSWSPGNVPESANCQNVQVPQPAGRVPGLEL